MKHFEKLLEEIRSLGNSITRDEFDICLKEFNEIQERLVEKELKKQYPLKTWETREEKLKSIEIAFENCEVCKLLPNMFKCLIIHGIKESMDINCYQYENGEIIRMKTCEYFSITINEKGLNTETWNGTLKERLRNFKDIVAVTLHYENKEEEIYVPWNEEDDFTNKYQTIEETDENIEVRISKEEV